VTVVAKALIPSEQFSLSITDFFSVIPRRQQGKFHEMSA
jgi:hypothetical protein